MLFYQFIPKLFSTEFCDKILLAANAKGFEKATVDVYGQAQKLTNIRNNYRLEFTDESLSGLIHEKIITTNIPSEINGLKYYYPSDEFRVYLYDINHYFKPHKDGHVKKDNMESKITCLIYLNDTQGGETILMPDGFSKKSSYIYIQPEKGSVLLFEHPLWHEGKPVHSGQKFVLRTNLFYQ